MLAVQGQRQQHGLAVAAVGQGDGGQRTGGVQVRVLEQIVRAGDGRERQALVLEDAGDMRGAVAGHGFAQQRHQPAAGLHAVVVAAKARIVTQLLQAKGVAELAPCSVADHGQKDLLAALDLEHVVDRPGRNACGHGCCRLAGHRVLHHVLGDQKHIVLEQSALHFLALAGLLALGQGRHGSHGTEHAAHDVVDTGARAQRVAGPARHIGQAAHHLHHLVEGRAVFVGAGQKALVTHIDEAWELLLETFIVQAQLLHGAGLEVLGHHIGRGDQLERGLLAFGGLQIQRQAFLVAVEQREKARARAQQLARGIAVAAVAHGLDLDDFGAQVGQHQAAAGAHDHMGELHHADAAIGQGGGSLGGFG